jgi:4-phospho-D-threonate 3-dehydrogenase / 4-phospho-D-erythronate 3-dehydrogenase
MSGGYVKTKHVIGIILGDHAGIGPETVAKALIARGSDYIPVLVGNRALFEKVLDRIPENKSIKIKSVPPTVERESLRNGQAVYFVDIHTGEDIVMGQISVDSGELIFQSIKTAMQMEKTGVVDGLVMAPITKQSLHKAGLNYDSEFALFADFYNVAEVKAVIKCGDIYRSTVVGHCAFSQIIEMLDTQGIVSTAEGLLEVLRRFRPADDCKIVIAALNPHAGEDGLFGDEEERIIKPAIDILFSHGEKVIGPFPADTVLLKALHEEVSGIVYLYHDQGNIAMKSRFFGEAVLIYTGVPAHIVSVSHGSALDIAGRGEADAKNLISCIDVLCQMLRHDEESNVDEKKC